MTNSIEVINLSKKYKTKEAVTNINFKINPNYRLILMIALLVFFITSFSINLGTIDFVFLNHWMKNNIFSIIFLTLCFLFIINGANLIMDFITNSISPTWLYLVFTFWILLSFSLFKYSAFFLIKSLSDPSTHVITASTKIFGLMLESITL